MLAQLEVLEGGVTAFSKESVVEGEDAKSFSHWSPSSNTSGVKGVFQGLAGAGLSPLRSVTGCELGESSQEGTAPAHNGVDRPDEHGDPDSDVVLSGSDARVVLMSSRRQSAKDKTVFKLVVVVGAGGKIDLVASLGDVSCKCK